MSDSLSETVFGIAGGDPSTDYDPWGSGPPVGGYAPTTTGANQTAIPSSIDPNAGRVDPHAVIEFDNFLGYPLASGTPLYLLSQFTPLINLNGNATDGLSGLSNITPKLKVSGQEIYFQNNTQLFNFLQRSAAPTASESSQVQSIALSTLGSELSASAATTYATQIADGASPGQVQAELARSPQSATNITNFFEQIYMRPPTGYEISEYETYLCTQSLFSARGLAAHGSEAATFINGQFLSVLNRNATATEIAAAENTLTAGESELDLRSTLAHSSEEYNDLNNAFIAATGAPGNPSEIANFQNSIAYNPNSQETVKSWIAYSPATVQAIDQIYQNIFQSQPSQADLAAREASIQAGATLANLTQSLAPYAQSNINQVWWNIVGRAPVASELSGAIANLAAGATLAQAEGWLADSSECEGKVNNVFVSILNHSADWDTLTGYQNSLAGGNSLTVERSWVAYGSDAQNEITAAFQNEVGRAPTASEMGAQEDAFDNGGSMQGLWSNLAPESALTIETIFNDEFGRTPTAAELASNEGYFADGATRSNIESSLSRTSEAVGDISTGYLHVTAQSVEPDTLSQLQSVLASGGSIGSVAQAIVVAPDEQFLLNQNYQQVLGQDAAPGVLATASSAIQAAIAAVGSINYSNLETTIGNAISQFMNELGPFGSSAYGATPSVAQAVQAANLAQARLIVSNTNDMAFLHTVEAAEHGGTYNPGSDYNSLYGNRSFTDLTKYPELAIPVGAYQIQPSTYDEASKELGIYDMQPGSQDLYAAYEANKRGAFEPLQQGNLSGAIAAATHVWAAVPISSTADHSSYKYSTGVHAGQYQPSLPYAQFVQMYHSFGGTGN